MCVRLPRANPVYSSAASEWYKRQDNAIELTGDSVTDSTYSTRVNLLYSPTKVLTFGAEYAYAHREVESGLEGDMNRIQVSAKYAF